MTVIAAAKVPRLGYALLLYFPPSITQENLMTSYNDVTIVCSINLVGKPLHMCRRTAIAHLHTCQHPCQINQKLWRFQTSLSLFQTLFHACDIYIYIHIFKLSLQNVLTFYKNHSYVMQ